MLEASNQDSLEVAAIAREVLGVEHLEPRNSDTLDFHDVHVGLLRKALERAVAYGRQSAGAPQTSAA